MKIRVNGVLVAALAVSRQDVLEALAETELSGVALGSIKKSLLEKIRKNLVDLCDHSLGIHFWEAWNNLIVDTAREHLRLSRGEARAATTKGDRQRGTKEEKSHVSGS